MAYVPYLDCCATSPIENEVLNEVVRFLTQDFGNSGSRTHDYGAVANRAVERARRSIAKVVDCDPAEVLFTSGATESNNLVLLGIAQRGAKNGRTHIVSTAIEHKAVLEPLDELRKQGFKVTLVQPTATGRVQADDVLGEIRDDTLLVSCMHANNETGVVQPLDEIASGLIDRDVYFHTDAAQSFGKIVEDLRNPRIDLISISGHKIFGPKGIGALVVRRRNGMRPPISPLMYGGGQERGLRPGTIPVALVAGLGKAAEIALRDHAQREERCLEFRNRLLNELAPLEPTIHGDTNSTMPHVVNLSFGDIDSEAIMLALRETVAISNGSACTSESYTTSHVLRAMQMTDAEAETATRWSWCHRSEEPDWDEVRQRIKLLL